jgi:hypothetical protein
MKKIHKAFNLGCLLPGDSSDVDAIHLYVTDGPKGEGCLYEFTIALVQFRDGNYAMQARIFSDAWRAFDGCREVFTILDRMHDCFRSDEFPYKKGPEVFDSLVSNLERAGWKNEGRKQPRFYRRCSECGSDVKTGVSQHDGKDCRRVMV